MTERRWIERHAGRWSRSDGWDLERIPGTDTGRYYAVSPEGQKTDMGGRLTISEAQALIDQAHPMTAPLWTLVTPGAAPSLAVWRPVWRREDGWELREVAGFPNCWRLFSAEGLRRPFDPSLGQQDGIGPIAEMTVRVDRSYPPSGPVAPEPSWKHYPRQGAGEHGDWVREDGWIVDSVRALRGTVATGHVVVDKWRARPGAVSSPLRDSDGIPLLWDSAEDAREYVDQTRPLGQAEMIEILKSLDWVT